MDLFPVQKGPEAVGLGGHGWERNPLMHASSRPCLPRCRPMQSSL